MAVSIPEDPPPHVWTFEVDACVSHVQDDPYPMLILERHVTGKGREIYKAASLKHANAGFELMIFASVLRRPRASGVDCGACVYFQACPKRIAA